MMTTCCANAAARFYRREAGNPVDPELPCWAAETWPGWREVKDLVYHEIEPVWESDFLARDAAGGNPGRNYIRVALVASTEECVEAAQRLKPRLPVLLMTGYSSQLPDAPGGTPMQSAMKANQAPPIRSSSKWLRLSVHNDIWRWLWCMLCMAHHQGMTCWARCIQ